MAQLTIATEERIYRVSPDDSIPQAALIRLLITGQIVDELTVGPLRTPPHPEVIVVEPGFSAQMKPNGFFGIAGIALHCLSKLATDAYQVHLTVRVPGYVPLELSAKIPQISDFPNELPQIVELGQIALHREPVLIAGRVTSKQDNKPIAGATGGVTGVWLAMPPPNIELEIIPPSLVAIRPSLYSGPDSATVRPVILTPVTGQENSLPFGAPAGAKTLSLDNRLGLDPVGNDILGIDLGTAIEEFIQTISVTGASTADLPAEARLTHALRNSHRRGAAVTVVMSQTSGPAKSLNRSGIPGDAVIFVSDLTGWDTVAAVEIDDGASTEYHSISHFKATTDAAGFYRFPPISRVAGVEFEAPPWPQKQERKWTLNYSKPVNQVDFHI